MTFRGHAGAVKPVLFQLGDPSGMKEHNVSYPGLPSLPQGPALSPNADARELFKLAQENPAMWQAIAEHPNAYPGLLDWLEKVGPAPVKAAVSARKARKVTANPVPEPVRPAPASLGPTPLPSARPAPLPYARPEKGAESPLPKVEPIPRQAPKGPVQKVAPVPVAAQKLKKTPAEFEPPVAVPLPRAQMPEPEDKTVLAKRHRKTQVLATLSWDGADPVPLTQTRVLLGRKVGPDDAEAGLQVVAVKEPSKTVSAKHAKLELVDGTWYIEDLNSTNGIYLVLPDGEEQQVKERSAVAQGFYLGDVLCHIETTD